VHMGAAVEQQSSATNSIADAVGGASQAAKNTADCLSSVTAAATRCNQAAANMHGISLNVAQQMVELQKSLARLLHTRIAELDRRASARHPVRIAAQLKHDGGVHRLR
jgi:methyl-accepting chemotaxis protein